MLAVQFLVALGVGLFVYASLQPSYQLQPTMPPDFVDAPDSATPAERSEQVTLASDYWDCAVNEIQHQYAYGVPLPQTPPPQFRVDSGKSESQEGRLARDRYWHKLQDVWFRPDAWRKEYTWDTSWVHRFVEHARRSVEDYVRSLVGHN